MLAGMLFSTMGAASLPATFASAAQGACATQIVRITLAGEQIEFCAPTNQPYTAVEDSAADPVVSYAGLNQTSGIGIINIKATTDGHAPGPGRPVFYLGGISAYRQAVEELETAKADRTVSNGPTGIFWEQNVPGIQIEATIPAPAGSTKLRTIEWNVEHNGRLWSFNFAWDIQMPNAAGWKAAASVFSVRMAATPNLGDTANDLGTAFLESTRPPGNSIMGGPIDASMPSWWNGICDDGNYYDAKVRPYHPVQLAAWHGVSACSTNGGPDHLVQFFTNAYGEFEFECVELVMRFLYMQWGIGPFNGNGNTLKDHYPADSMIFYPNDGTHPMVPGDILTEDGNGSYPNGVGHAVIITAVALDGNGTGTINILEQNASNNGTRALSVKKWIVDPDSYTYGQAIQGWLHARANQPDGDLDSTFTIGTGVDGPVNAIGVQSNNKIVIAGDFTHFKSTMRAQVARLSSTGKLDTTFDPGMGVTSSDGAPHVTALAIQPADSYVLIGGHFDHFKTSARNSIARLNTSGELDTSFNPGTGITRSDGSPAIVNALAIQPGEGFILAGGDFDRFNGTPVSNLVRLNTTGGLDDSYSAVVNGPIYSICIQPDGMSLVGGNFSTVNGQPRAGIARIKTDGSLDTNFNPGTGIGSAGTYVASIALQSDGKILIGGSFTSYNRSTRYKIARLSSNGALDGTFNAGTGLSGTSEVVKTVVPQADGRILIGGNFSDFLERRNSDGSQDNSFMARTDGEVDAMVLQPDNNILIGGYFTAHTARLLNHIEPCYALTTQVTPLAGGSISVDLAPNCPGGKYINGTTVHLTALLNPDYWLVNWSGAASSAENPLSVSMSADKTVIANLMASPGAFNRIAPANGDTGVALNPVLRWESSVGATSYEYCLYTSATTYNNYCAIETPVSHWISTGPATSVILNNVVPSVVYYWQVRARNQVDTTNALGAHGWTFTSNGIPAVPVSVSPNGTNFIDFQPSYVWNASPGATAYHLIVHSINGDSNVIDTVLDNPTCLSGVCTYQPAEGLAAGSYKYEVQAKKDSSSYSEFSVWRNFSLVIGVKNFLPLLIKYSG
jgi:uncharacterized delta-60 repeat protein